LTAPHFFVEELGRGEVLLTEGDSRHALRSLRLRPGDEVSLADGRGGVGLGRLVGERNGIALVQVGDVSPIARPAPALTVAFAAPKGDRLSWAIQKLGELGVEEATLMRTARSVRDVPAERAAQALARLRAVAREAAMQARQAFVMEVSAGARLEDCLAKSETTTLMLVQTGQRGLRSVLPGDGGGVRLLVGPEGGWADEEVEGARRAGAGLWSLGPSILRTETAAVVAAALVLAHLGRLG
jgi:16S rRNA (uracil1498-N3)-methyltransferase